MEHIIILLREANEADRHMDARKWFSRPGLFERLYFGLRTPAAATAADCQDSLVRLQTLLDELEIMRNPTKGVWDENATSFELLGNIFDAVKMSFIASPTKVRKVKGPQG
jgi:hypothetical protein